MSFNNPSRIRRRQFVKTAAAATVGSALAATQASAKEGAGRQPALIREENAKEGARDWQLTRVRVQAAKGGLPNEAYRSPWIEGYCSKQSVAAGEEIEFKVSTKPAARFIIEIFRNGYY